MDRIAKSSSAAPAVVPAATAGSGRPDSGRPDAAADLPRRTLAQRIAEVRFSLTVIAAVGVVTLGQVVEDVHDSPPIQLLSPAHSIPRWTLIVVVAYMLLVLKALEEPVQRALAALRPAVQIPDAQFAPYLDRMRHTHRRVDLGLFVASALIVIVLIPVGGLELPATNDPVTHRPLELAAGVDGIVELLAYTVVGWAGLNLIYGTLRLARTLGELSREPITVNVFDTTPLIPFGRIALGISLAPAGVIAILLLGLGQPNGPVPWMVLFLATSASILALLLPLRGVHHQMWIAKRAAWRALNRQLTDIYDRLEGREPVTPPELAEINGRAGTLLPLRKLVSDMTTWPFQDTVAFMRAVLIASSPLIYTALNELIQVFLISPLTH